MQYPFLKMMFGDAAEKGDVLFVSIMVGDVPKSKLKKYAEILSTIVEKEDTLVAVSSDFCHHGSDSFGFAPTIPGLKQFEVVE